MNTAQTIQSFSTDVATACSNARLAIVVMATLDGPPLATVPVNSADLKAACSEAWRDCCLRCGFPDMPLADTAIDVIPRPSASCPDRCDGYAIAVRTPDGQVRTTEFSLLSLSNAADRVAKGLVDEGLLQDGAKYFYRLVLRDAEPLPREEPVRRLQPRISVRYVPTAVTTISLAALLGQAERVGTPTAGAFPVFYRADAHAKAEAAARRGVAVETGGVLCGLLGFCESTLELFPIVTDVIEVAAAEETEFTLAYTGSSWLQIHEELGRLQSQSAGRRMVILGNCHGHNFLPHRDRSCEGCERQSTCDLTSVFASKDDLAWHLAVFARQPWALCHVFGLDARGQHSDGLFTLHDGRLKTRGYYIIPKTALLDL